MHRLLLPIELGGAIMCLVAVCRWGLWCAAVRERGANNFLTAQHSVRYTPLEMYFNLGERIPSLAHARFTVKVASAPGDTCP